MNYLLYAFLWILGLWPLWMLYVFSDICYYLIYNLLRYRRKVVRMNLRRAFPEKSIEEIVEIEKKYYRHLCDLFVEMYKMWHMSEKQIRKRCHFVNPEVIQDCLEQGKSVVVVLGHYGNWEWMSSYSLWMPRNIDFFTLYKPLHSRVIDKMMFHLRSRFGAKPIPKNDVLRWIVKDRREGRQFLAAFIGDQTPNKNNLNFWMEFLNQDTAVLVGTEKIARKYNLPVVSLKMVKVRRGYYEVRFVNVCSDPVSLEEGELTRRHTRLLEQYIREVPELWLWSHRRWKHTRE